MKVDAEILKDFEEELNPAKPENIKILGYGEISTVFEIPEHPDIAFKRIPMFRSVEQVKKYIDTYFEYTELLRMAGLKIPESDALYVTTSDGGIVLFLIQEKLEGIGNKILQNATLEDALDVFESVLKEMKKVWDFNEARKEKRLQIGLDGQISNWAICGGGIYYFDTSTPMIRKNGVDMLDTDIFLRACPPGTRILLKKFFLQEILDRYYDFRSVVLDMIANLSKEGRSDLIPPAINLANEFFEHQGYAFEPIQQREVEKYYREDAFIWSLYLHLRKIHRFVVTKILFGRYEFILPGKIRR